MFASVALVIMILWWWAHARVRPYYFNSQNAMESWFYGCNVLLVILGMAYTAVSDNVKSTNLASKNILLALEVMLEIDLFGGIVLIILYFLYDLRRQRRSLACVDLVAALDITRQKIDKPVMKQLNDGSIRLLRCGWLLSDEADSVLREDTEDHGVVVRMRRCQSCRRRPSSHQRRRRSCLAVATVLCLCSHIAGKSPHILILSAQHSQRFVAI